MPYKRKAKGGGKLARTETVTVRLDPKSRYLTELAARKHSRTVSSYIEWKIKESLESEAVRPVDTPAHAAAPETIGSESEYLWDVEEADRFAKLSMRYPHLLTHEEQVLWKLVRENGFLWYGSYRGPGGRWIWSVNEQSIIWERLREHWEAFRSAAEGGSGLEGLPTWPRVKPSESSPPPLFGRSPAADYADPDDEPPPF